MKNKLVISIGANETEVRVAEREIPCLKGDSYSLHSFGMTAFGYWPLVTGY